MALVNYFLIIGFFIACYNTNLSRQVALKGKNVRDAEANEFPYVVSIGTKNRKSQHKNTHFCTGTLITKKHVITAEHCVRDMYPINVELTIGSSNLELGTKYYPSHWITYKQWKYGRFLKYAGTSSPDDIAIVTLTTNFPHIKPANLTQLTTDQLSGSELKIAGWGITNSNKKPKILKTALLKVISNEQCNEQLGNLTNEVISVGENVICSKADPWIVTDCGDSGGPSFDKDNGLVGITVGRCPHEDYFVVKSEILEQNLVVLHTNVNYYKDFIESVIKNY